MHQCFASAAQGATCDAALGRYCQGFCSVDLQVRGGFAGYHPENSRAANCVRRGSACWTSHASISAIKTPNPRFRTFNGSKSFAGPLSRDLGGNKASIRCPRNAISAIERPLKSDRADVESHVNDRMGIARSFRRSPARSFLVSVEAEFKSFRRSRSRGRRVKR